MKITVGFRDEHDSVGREVDVQNIEELAHIVVKENYSLGVFKDNHRKKEKFISADSIALDFDEGYSIEDAKRDFETYSHIIAPSRSHRKPKEMSRKEAQGKRYYETVVADRFRVILFLENQITDYDTFVSTWHALAKPYPASDFRCKDATRFWFKSTDIYSLRKGGKRIPVVSPPPVPEKRPMSELNVEPGTKGQLSKKTKEFLEKGEQSGGRNDATMRAARDFQQQLYTVDEAIETIVSALHANGTIERDFPEHEVVTTIKSTYRSEAKHEPRIREKAFRLRRIGELYKATEGAQINWVVDELCMVGGVSLLSGDPKVGKSVIARQICKAVLNGALLFGRKTKKGTVHYYGIEEDEQIISNGFNKLGIPGDGDLFVHDGDPITDVDVFKDFSELILETKPTFAVVDTAFDILEVESENNYAQVKRAFRKMRKVARKSGTHIMLLHHNGKPQKDFRRRGNHSPLGSTGITAGVDSIIVVNLEGSTRIIYTSGREVEPWDGYLLKWDKATKTYSLGPKYVEDEF